METKILKTGTCPSVSGKSTLTYHIGTAGAGIQIRIHENTGAGRFSNEWLPLKAIEKAVGKTPFTSTKLYQLFHGRSLNTSAFMLAVLLNEGLVKHSETEKGSYVWTDSSAFMKDKRSPKSRAKTKEEPAHD